jgi:hypothetical protein
VPFRETAIASDRARRQVQGCIQPLRPRKASASSMSSQLAVTRRPRRPLLEAPSVAGSFRSEAAVASAMVIDYLLGFGRLT